MRTIMLVLLIALQVPLIAQNKSAQEMLDILSEKYEAYRSFEITFDLEVKYPERPVQKQKAQIIQASKRFKFISEDQDIIGDGENVYLFLKDRNEVQINDFDEDDELGLMTPKDLLKEYDSGRFEYRLENETDTEIIIVFKPLDRDSEFFKYRIAIDKQSEDFSKIDAYNKDGSQLLVTIASSSQNKEYNDEFFSFDTSLYPDIRIEDLRID